MTRYSLKNPRSHVKDASIVYEPTIEKWILSYQSKDGHGKTDFSSSLSSAKRLFSTHVIEPKHWGKNEWERNDVVMNKEKK